MSVKMQTTCTWTERPYEASLFPGIDFEPFLHSLGGRRRKKKRPPFQGWPKPSVRYHSRKARTLTLRQDLREKGQQFIWGLGLPKGNGGMQRFPRVRQISAPKCKGRRELDCKTHPSSRDEINTSQNERSLIPTSPESSIAQPRLRGVFCSYGDQATEVFRIQE
ncbi:hypothetical protein Cgig2_024585 [Carnegiea gigantea]|uniref:Uncharacterized protein n=1 Tax=Carnegiea gigantea TaxID=171969 RepID=A0A9Q1KIQ1_9CARY|nr:hypothetical protein Cgig2_024585 [Carnegiea gigantea]